MLPWQTLAGALERHGKAVAVTVVAAKGSTPREAGARLFVVPGGGFLGTIGGGALEWQALARAQAMLDGSGEGFALRDIALGPELGQCCGGRVTLAFERFPLERLDEVRDLAAREAAGRFVTEGAVIDGRLIRRVVDRDATAGAVFESGRLTESFGDTRRPVLLCGAGHVGRALVLAMAPLPFSVRWVDPRPDTFPGVAPANVVAEAGDPVAAVAAAPDDSFVLVLTHSHALDLAIVEAALAAGRFPYVGLIGSATKRARFRKRLAEAGLDAGRIDRMVCPIGIPGIRSKIPAVIAASVAADLLLRDEALTASRGTVSSHDQLPGAS